MDIGHSITSGVHFTTGSALTHGTYLIAAHVNSRNLGLSPFAQLWKAQPGMLVWVTDPENHTHRFKITMLAKYTKTALPPFLWTPEGPSSVALVTCGGPLLTHPDGTHSYADNVVVRAFPAGIG